MKTFEYVKTRYALATYFKNRHYGWPDTLMDIYDYSQQYGELPFRYEGNNWIYDTMNGWQRRNGVQLSQYLTPDHTAMKMAELAIHYFDNESHIVDACCGTGQLSRALIAQGLRPSALVAFDADRSMTEIFGRLYPAATTTCCQYRDIDFRCENVVANPPFDIPECTGFLEWLSSVQDLGDCSILLLPLGFIDKQRPSSIQKILQQFHIYDRIAMTETFARTCCLAEIVVFKKR